MTERGPPHAAIGRYLEQKFAKILARETDKLTGLMNMGFDHDVAKKALEASEGDENRAAELLLSGRFRSKPKIADPNGQWSCGACTMFNMNVQRRCQVCNSPWEDRDPQKDIMGEPPAGGGAAAAVDPAGAQLRADEESARRLAERERQDALDDDDPLRQALSLIHI